MCLTVSRRSRDLRSLSRNRSVTFHKKFPNCLKRPKNVVWQSANGRVTSDHCRVTVQWLFSKNFLIAWNVQKTLFDSRPTVSWPPTTVTWPFSDFFQKIFKLLETCKNVVWQSADGSVTTDHCHVTVQLLFSKFFLIAWIVQKTLFDSRPTVAWPPTTVAWLFSHFFFKKFPNCLKRPKNVVWQSVDGCVTSNHCRVTVERLFSKFFLIAWNVVKTLFDSRPTVAWPPTTVAWPFSDFFQNFSELLETSKKCCLTVCQRSRDVRPLSRDRSATFFQIFPNCLKRQKTLFDSRPTVALPPTTVAWPFSDFFQNSSYLLETSKKRSLTVGQWSRELRQLSRYCSATFVPFFAIFVETSKKLVWKPVKSRLNFRLFRFRGFCERLPHMLASICHSR